MKPTYKPLWDLPGGYVEPGESPRQACIHEVREELGITVGVRDHLVVDWAPADDEGDKLLFIFDPHPHTETSQIRVDGVEIERYEYLTPENLAGYVPPRLERRTTTALTARARGRAAYAEHGTEPS